MGDWKSKEALVCLPHRIVALMMQSSDDHELTPRAAVDQNR